MQRVQAGKTGFIALHSAHWAKPFVRLMQERAKADARKLRAETYAKRFAAKEAASKALGTGFRAGVFWRDLGVVNLPSGQPTLRLTGGAAERLKAITPAGHGAVIALTMTDEFPYAQAMVVITAVPLP